MAGLQQFDSQFRTWDLNRNYCALFMLKNTFTSKRRSQQMMILWRSDEKIMLVLLEVSRKGVQYHEKAQLLSFDSWNMRYPPSRLCNSYWLKNFTLIKILSFIINRFYLSCFFSFFLWLFYSMITETTNNSCSFEISALFKFFTMMLN